MSFSRNPLLSSSGSGTVRGPLTAEMLEVPQTHNGTSAFQFTLSFSEDVANGKDDITGAVLTLVGGSISSASQLRSPSHKEWRVRIQPSGAEDVSITLQADRDCDTSGAVCTEDGRKLTQTITKTVTGPQTPTDHRTIAIHGGRERHWTCRTVHRVGSRQQSAHLAVANRCRRLGIHGGQLRQPAIPAIARLRSSRG